MYKIGVETNKRIRQIHKVMRRHKENMEREGYRSDAIEKMKMKVEKMILGLDWDRSWCT
jgi:hypothetical protein